MTMPSVTIPRNDLLAALGRTSFQAGKLATHALGCVWITATGGGLTLAATDGTLDASCRILAPGKPVTPFACGVPAGQFRKLVERLPDAPVTLALDVSGDKLRVKCGRSNSGIPVRDVADRPTVEMPPDTLHAVPKGRLAAAIARVAFAAGDEELEQVRFTPPADDVGGLSIEAVSQNAYARDRLFRPEGGTWPGIVPEAFGVDPARISGTVKWLETATRMAVTEKRVFFADDLGWWSLPVRRGIWTDAGNAMVSKLSMPDVTHIDIAVSELACVCDRLGIVLPEKSRAVLLDASPGGITFTADGGQGVEIADGARLVSGKPVKVVIPAQDFGALASRVPGERLRLTLTGWDGPMGFQALTDAGDPDPSWLGVIMPLMAPTPTQFSEWEDAA
jgi:hypothetical protein